MVKYVKFQNTQQRKFMMCVKNGSGFTWSELALRIGISKSMIFYYLDETSKLPYETYLFLSKYPETMNLKREIEILDYNIQKNVTIPDKNDPMLAELVGVLLGDGSLSRVKYAINITMNGELDVFFVNNTLKEIFKELFLKTPSIYKSAFPKQIKIVFYSKKVYDFLSDTIGLPHGKRKYNPNNVIPFYILNNKTLLKCALRGLFDTEGGIYPHNKTLARVDIYNTSEFLLDSMDKAFKLLNFHPIRKKDRIKLCRTSEIIRFFEEIQPHNPQKILKYTMWQQNKRVPKNQETLEFLNSQHGCGLVV